MEFIFFYIKLGIFHVLDWNAYDHLLFLSAMALPFSFKNNKQLLFLVSAFTLTHCTSLALSSYELVVVNTSIIEFLIPVSIVLMLFFNAKYAAQKTPKTYVHLIATSLFGFIHGFGFSNYFKMLISDTDEKITALFSFAFGLEIAQLIIITIILSIGYLIFKTFKIVNKHYLQYGSALIGLLTLPLLYHTFISLIGG